MGLFFSVRECFYFKNPGILIGSLGIVELMFSSTKTKKTRKEESREREKETGKEEQEDRKSLSSCHDETNSPNASLM